MATLTHDRATELIAEADAQERDQLLAGILGNIEQTFDGQFLYPTVEQRAATLLYFIVKDHALLDGSKRGAAILFEEYLRINNLRAVAPQEFGRLVRDIEAGRPTDQHKERMTAEVVDAIQRSNA